MCLRCCSQLTQMSLTASLEFDDYAHSKGCITGVVLECVRSRRRRVIVTNEKNLIQLKEQNTRLKAKKKKGKKRGARGVNVDKLQARLAAKQTHLCKAETSRTSQDGHTHPHTQTHKADPQGVVIKAFIGILIEG